MRSSLIVASDESDLQDWASSDKSAKSARPLGKPLKRPARSSAIQVGVLQACVVKIAR